MNIHRPNSSNIDKWNFFCLPSHGSLQSVLADLAQDSPIKTSCSVNKNEFLLVDCSVWNRLVPFDDFGSVQCFDYRRETALLGSHDTWVKTSWYPNNFVQFPFTMINRSFYKTPRLPQILYQSFPDHLMGLNWPQFCHFCVTSSAYNMKNAVFFCR